MNWHELQTWTWNWVQWIKGRLTSADSRFSSLEEKVKEMSDILDKLKDDFEAYKSLVDSTLASLQAKVAELTAGQLDPAKAQALDDEINAARAALNPPAA